MSFSRDCETCGKRIVFKRNNSGKPVPFDLIGPGIIGQCHYETCTQPPGSSLYASGGSLRSGVPRDLSIKERAYYRSNVADKLMMREAVNNRKLSERFR
jgi:hypothetical protein